MASPVSKRFFSQNVLKNEGIKKQFLLGTIMGPSDFFFRDGNDLRSLGEPKVGFQLFFNDLEGILDVLKECVTDQWINRRIGG